MKVVSNCPSILYRKDGTSISSATIHREIENFDNSYNASVQKIIILSRELDSEGKIFLECAARILINFKMTRRGPFEGISIAGNRQVIGGEILKNCWDLIGEDLLDIKARIKKFSAVQPERFLLDSIHEERDNVISKIWKITKKILPYTMGKTTYGLVGASKIMFSVLPEIVLPVDNTQWLKVFRTVDLGDVVWCMINEIERWEEDRNEQLNLVDKNGMLTTLPAVYNVMAMKARP